MTDEVENFMLEGWEAYRREVLKQGWPDDEITRVLLETTFYAGAVWMRYVIADQGVEVLKQIEKELDEHRTRTRARVEALKAEEECDGHTPGHRE